MSTYSKETLKTSEKSLVECQNLLVKYDNQTIALKDINLSINSKEFIYIIGPNGAGKSTLIKLFTGLLTPTEGKLILSTNDIGYLPQLTTQKNNFPITVNEVIYTGFKKQQLIMSKKDKALINTWLIKMNLEDMGNTLISTLSGGQQQRVFLIRALVSNPKLLILDEPTSALDPSFRHAFNDLLKTLNLEGTTIIYITHDIKEIYENAKIIYLDQSIEFFGDYKSYQAWGGHHHV